ncbi:TPA_asm: IS5 family transposase [Salmonella enterica subsp. enterica serovar Mbandaka]|nr:IS5 family transposase [Salmonella enterica subsp. enterica serovar Mbandaka]
MSTKMTDADWANTLEVFRACLPRRGRKAADDRLFLEAMHFFTVENVRWRALPERFGPWNSVWKRFDRLSKVGVFETFFETLTAMGTSAHLIQMFNSAIVRAHISAAGAKRGQPGQALGRSRGGFTTKIHAKADSSGHLIAFDLTGGEASDTRHFETLLDIGPDITPRAALADKGYSSKSNRAVARARGIAPVVPHKSNEKNKPSFFAKTLYKARARIKQGFGRLKRFKRVALRCGKTQRNYRSIVSFAAALCRIKFVHTAWQGYDFV